LHLHPCYAEQDPVVTIFFFFFFWGSAPKPRRGVAPDPTKGAELLWNPAILGRFWKVESFVFSAVSAAEWM
jgi:hypothetical protein